MRILLSAILTAFMCSGLPAAESDADSAIQEAINGLEAKLPSIKSSADKKKVTAAIESLKGKLSKGKTTSEGKPIDAAALKGKFNGKADYDRKSGELTIVYDFKDEDQLEDFEQSEDSAKPKLIGGKLIIGGKDSMKHKVEFSRVKVSADFQPKRFDDTNQWLLWFNAPGRFECSINNAKQLQIRIFSDGEQIGDGLFKPKSPISLVCEVTTNKMRFSYNNREIVGNRKVTGTAGHVHLQGGTEGLSVSKLTIQGVPEQLWLESFMEE